MKAEALKMTDDELVKQCLNNNQAAQKELFVRFSSKMLGVCLRYISSRDDAEDVLQDAFIKVFNKLDKYSGIGSFEGWIRRIVVNTALDFLRKNKKMQLNSSIDDIGYGIKKEQFIVEDLTAKELMKIIQTIPLGYKTIFNMYAIEGYSHKEIAQELDISESTSKSQLSRARAVIKKLLNENKLI
jgi:RNA polymerase sigma-70 factor (ECF subfamily)|tara:strand:+ start:63 stop:617 length:555 start_codon:yes stop_codon:yes gene_type:complete